MNAERLSQKKMTPDEKKKKRKSQEAGKEIRSASGEENDENEEKRSTKFKQLIVATFFSFIIIFFFYVLCFFKELFRKERNKDSQLFLIFEKSNVLHSHQDFFFSSYSPTILFYFVFTSLYYQVENLFPRSDEKMLPCLD